MSKGTTEEVVGTGTSVFDQDEPVTGTVHFVTNPQEVMQLLNEDLDNVIGLVRAGTCSFASPLLSNGVGGLITMEGAPTSHLGILSREFNIACVMSMEPEEDLGVPPDHDEYFQRLGESIDGRTVRLDTSDGTVYEIDGERS
jgi:phosphohistidine swiveling domain-containing protein